MLYYCFPFQCYRYILIFTEKTKRKGFYEKKKPFVDDLKLLNGKFISLTYNIHIYYK